VNRSLPAPLPLIDVFCTSDDCNRLARFFIRVGDFPVDYPLVVLEFISHFFRRSPQTQETFFCVGLIESSLTNHPESLTAELYNAICLFFKSITLPSLQKAWFDSLILNLWLWSQSSSRDFYRVLHHWSHVLCLEWADLFLADSYFTVLLNQYVLFFCPPGLLRERHSPEAIHNCGDLFLQFLARVATVSLTENDCTSICTHIAHFRDKQMFLHLTKLYIDIAPELVKMPELVERNIIDFMEYVQHSDIDIVEVTLITLHQMTQHQMTQHQSHIPMMAAAAVLANRPAQIAVFERMCSRLIEFPNLFTLLCLLALRLSLDQK
jgi:hypothetical protein